MNWKGKIVGSLIGLLFTSNILGLLLGLFIGHLYDIGHFNRYRTATSAKKHSSQSNVQRIFFDSSFAIMGYLAKSDGRVTETEISIAKQIMGRMSLNQAMRQEAIRLFTVGKQPEFDLHAVIANLKRACWLHPSLLKTFLEFQIQMAYAGGEITPGKKGALKAVFTQMGIPGFRFEQFENQYRTEQNYRRHGRSTYSNPKQHLNEAYQVLGIPASTNDADVKKAYRRLMNKHHPDKLVAKGIPPEMVKLATEKTQQIKSAYEQIKQSRGFS